MHNAHGIARNINRPGHELELLCRIAAAIPAFKNDSRVKKSVSWICGVLVTLISGTSAPGTSQVFVTGDRLTPHKLQTPAIPFGTFESTT